MKRALIILFAAGAVSFIGAGALADSHEGNGFKVIPVDLYGCTYNERKGPKDLDAYAEKFNAWADANGMNDFSVWTLTPYYYGPGENSGFDFIWMVASKNAVAMGKTHDKWLADNDGLQEDADEFTSCDGHSNFASVNYKPTPEGRTPENSVITFSDCNYREDATFEALGEAMGAWSEYIGGKGSEAGIFHWYPVYGGGGEPFDFKWLEVHRNQESLGVDYEIFGNGRGFEKYGELFGSLIKCDAARVYLAKNRRYVQLR